MNAGWGPLFERYRLRPGGELLDGEGNPAGEASEGPRELALDGLLCNDASMDDGEGGRTVVGNPTEGAPVVAAKKLGFGAEETRRRLGRVDSVPFESERQYRATLNDAPNGRTVGQTAGGAACTRRAPR